MIGFRSIWEILSNTSPDQVGTLFLALFLSIIDFNKELSFNVIN